MEKQENVIERGIVAYRGRRSVLLSIGFVLCVVAVFFFAGPQTSQAVSPNVAYWYLDENSAPFIDSVSGLEAICTNCPTIEASGVVGQAVRFNGTDTALSVTAVSSFDWDAADTFTIALWLKADVDTCHSSDEIFIGRGTAGSGHWALGCNAGDGTVFFALSDDSNNSVSLSSNKAITTGRWHHITALYVNGSVTLSLDATDVQSSTAALSGRLAASSAALHIGHLNGSAHFRGALDEVALYSVPLTANEIANQYYLARRYTAACSTAVRIMPLGDSITRGYGTGDVPTSHPFNVGYRRPLYLSLTSSGYAFDFVGGLVNGDADSGTPFDYDHQGVGGRRADEIRDNVNSYLNANPSDIVLLHIGTNDLGQGQLASSTAEDIEGILDNIDAFSENITVVLAQITDWQPNNANITALNNEIASLATARIVAGDKIILVDMQSPLVYPGDMFDAIHPNQSGYDKMADIWYDVLQNILQPCAEFAPIIISQPVVSATIGLPYQYNLQVTGNPPPAYSLITAPAGMTIDANGLIEWTPTGAGDYLVTVLALNSQGSDTQSFSINVADAVESLSCLPDGLVHYWRLDESSGATTFADYIAGLDTSLVGSSPINIVTPPDSKVGNAVDFNGTNQRLVTAASGNPTTGLTVMAWVNADDLSATGTAAPDQGIVSKRNAFILEVEENGDRISFSVYRPDNTFVEFEPPVPENLIVAGSWYHVAASWDASTQQSSLYLNGQFIASETTIAALNNSNEPYNIGWTFDFSSGQRFFDGRIDEVAIYDRALTSAEIARQYQAGLLNFGYDVDNWTVADGNWDDDNSWYGSVPGTGDYAIVHNNTDLTAVTTAACVDVMPNATLDFGGNELVVDGTFNNYGTVQQTKAADTVNTMVEFLRVQNTGNTETKYLGAEIAPTSTALGDVTVAIRAADVANGNDCTSDPGSPPYADRCFTITAGTDGPATVRLYAANPDELNTIPVGDLRPYRFASGWNALTTNLVTGTSGGFAYAQATTPGFSSFLLGGPIAPTAVSLHTFTAASPTLATSLVFLLGLLLTAPTAYLLRRRR